MHNDPAPNAYHFLPRARARAENRGGFEVPTALALIVAMGPDPGRR